LELTLTALEENHFANWVTVVSDGKDAPQFYKNKNGVNAYVVKPVNFSELISAVKQLASFGWRSMNRRRIRVTGTWFDLDRRGVSHEHSET
jgi:DNA-binding response OmpR family regulator